jgi:hypothetical protein
MVPAALGIIVTALHVPPQPSMALPPRTAHVLNNLSNTAPTLGTTFTSPGPTVPTFVHRSYTAVIIGLQQVS